MDEMPQSVQQVMEELYAPLPRQGPGSPASTRKAFSMLGPLPEQPLILDIGCGVGAQTMELAGLTTGHIIALDVFDWALDAVSVEVVSRGLAGRVHTTKQSMDAMDYREATFDVVWSEGALYIMGFENALRTCRRLLKPGGFLAASELCWFSDEPPEDLLSYWRQAYPDIRSVANNAQLIADCGLELLGHFALPARDWWHDFYTPMSRRLPGLRAKYADSPEALALFDECDTEMSLHKKYSRWYGYQFFVCQRPAE